MMPLSDILVLDLSRLLPGPFATRILADFGAEIVKIEDTGMGDLLRYQPPYAGKQSYAFHNLNRGKKSLLLDLKSDQGREVFLRLAERADVVLEGFRPGVMERLGIGAERLRERNPRLVVASISGYGQSGPRKNAPGHDINYQAYAGALGLAVGDAGRPIPSAVPAADLSGALFSVIGILLALRNRQKTGSGDSVDVAMLDAVFATLSLHLAPAFAGRPDPAGGTPLSGQRADYGVYRCRCGRYLAVGSMEPKFWTGLCMTLGKPDLIATQFGDAGTQAENREVLEAIFLTKTRDDWVAELEDKGLCVSPVNDLSEALRDPHLNARAMILEAEDPELGIVRHFAQPIRLSSASHVVSTRGPEAGEHTDEILQRLGYDETAVAQLRAAGAVG